VEIQHAKKLPSGHNCTTVSACVFATEACIDDRKNLLNTSISPTCPHNMVNVVPLTAEMSSGVWRSPANFSGFCVFASLLHWHRSVEVNQTLHDVWPSPGLVHCIYIFGALCVQVLRSPVLAALLHGTPAAGVSQTSWFTYWSSLAGMRVITH